MTSIAPCPDCPANPESGVETVAIGRRENQRGRPHRIIIGDPLPEEEELMSTAEEVRKKWERRQR